MSDKRTITMKNGGKISVPNGTLSFDGVDDSYTIDNLKIGWGRTGTMILSGHCIEYGDDFTSFKCSQCEEELEVPEIFQASTDFNAVIYQLYIIGHFKKNECPGPDEEDVTDPLDQTNDWPPDPSDGSTPPAGGNVHWITDNSLSGDVTISGDSIDAAARDAIRDRVQMTKRFK